MKVRYSVTFEFDTRPGLCHRGIVEGGRAATCVARATREAQTALKPINWASVVCVLLERLDDAPEEADDPPDEVDAVDPSEVSNTGTPTPRD